MLYTVYKHTNKVNSKVYIGITSRKPEDRWGNNGSNYSSSPYFYQAIKKYGWCNFNHDVLYEGLTKEEACNMEVELIANYKSNNHEFGYNMTSGGENTTMSDESRRKLSKALIGNKNCLGKKCPKERAERIGRAQIGKFVSEETRRKQSEAAHNRHIPCSEKKREILRNSYPRMKKVYCIETGMVYKSVQECARVLDIHANLVTKVCKNKLKTTGGYHLKYYDDMINA